MALKGSAFLALWNDFNPMRDEEYSLWHTREHVPERLTVPGILSARRYVAQHGPYIVGPHGYFTLYDLQSEEVLGSVTYKKLLDNPTPWSRSMRPDFRNFLRYPCKRLASVGQGLGGAATTVRFSREAAKERLLPQQAAEVCEGLIKAIDDITAVHLGIADLSSSFSFGQAQAPANENDQTPYVLIIEALDRAQIRKAMEILSEVPKRWFGASRCDINTYDLVFAMTRDDLHGTPAPFTPPHR